MSDTQDHIIQDQPIRVLSLFRKREIDSISFDLQKYSQLFDALSCTICRSVLSSPVYLKCSHRFCKLCIEKHIRLNAKKSCPNCRGNLNTKRDLHADFPVQSLLTFAFGDLKLLSQNLEKLESMELKLSVNARKQEPSLQKLRSHPEDLADSESAQVMKKIKLIDGEPRVRRKSVEVKIDSFQEAMDSRSSQMMKEIIKIKNSPKKTPKVNFIQIKSSSEDMNEPPLPLIKQERGISKEGEVQETVDEVGEAKAILQEEFGDNYLSKSIDLTPFECSVELTLKRITKNPLIPALKFKRIRLSIKSTLRSVAVLISKSLNVKISWIKLEVQEGQVADLNQRLLEVNQRVWKSSRGLDIFDIGQLVQKLQLRQPSQFERRVYYAVDVPTGL